MGKQSKRESRADRGDLIAPRLGADLEKVKDRTTEMLEKATTLAKNARDCAKIADQKALDNPDDAMAKEAATVCKEALADATALAAAAAMIIKNAELAHLAKQHRTQKKVDELNAMVEDMTKLAESAALSRERAKSAYLGLLEAETDEQKSDLDWKATSVLRSFATAYEREATPTGRNGQKNLTSDFDRRVAKMMEAVVFSVTYSDGGGRDARVGFKSPKAAMLFYIRGFEDLYPGAPCVTVAEAHQRVLLCKELRATREREPSLRLCAWCKEAQYCPSVEQWVWGPLITPTFRCAGCVPPGAMLPSGAVHDTDNAIFGRYCSAACQRAAWTCRKPSLFDEAVAKRSGEAGSSEEAARAEAKPKNLHRTLPHRSACPRYDRLARGLSVCA